MAIGTAPATLHRTPPARFVGINVGAETIKLVELIREDGRLRWARRAMAEHGKAPGRVLHEMLAAWDWPGVAGAAASGRLGRQVNLLQVPTKQAQLAGYRFLYGPEPATLVSIGSHGFSVLEVRDGGLEVFRENSRCSQGTGNFLQQLVERFSLTIEQASELCTPVAQPAVLSGRCPVILKTDMTHLANKGEDRARILAGLFDAVCENVLVLIKPGLCPPRVLLIGGVARAPRVRATFGKRLSELGLSLKTLAGDDGLYFEALGSAVAAAQQAIGVPPLAALACAPHHAHLERVPALAAWQGRVRRLPAQPFFQPNGAVPALLLGFDIGSTGSKAVALVAQSGEVAWEGYRATAGDPVGAAQALLLEFTRSVVARCPVAGFGVTGSGREIVGSLLTACYGKESVFVLNEIAAHAEGALHFDARVDTIFEIGGQDAKYIRLAGGRIVDCAMNEACSAGTGSFIAEQGGKFPGIRDVAHLGEEAMGAREGVSLGQHCSVFMAEVIDEAVASGVEQPAIIAGLYDSIIQNYLNRVKGSRSVGQVIFCQGMPFAADALASAVARQTGSEVIVPPNPGTIGALGIALLARREIAPAGAGLDAGRFLAAQVASKDTFRCKATAGCGAPGNRCRIDRLGTVVAQQTLAFTWGGDCALYDKGTRKKKLPDLSPDPFREREALAAELVAPLLTARGRPRIALTDEFSLKGLYPFFAAFFDALGFDLVTANSGGQADLKRGIQGANVPFCAPMQLYHGLSARLFESGADFIFLPMLRRQARQGDEPFAIACPIAQGSADLLRRDLAPGRAMRVVSPVIDFGPGNFASAEFLASCRALALELGVDGEAWRAAHRTASELQLRFETGCLEMGRRALDFCAARDIVPVVVLGRPYTIFNTVLNSNVPAILREQGVIGIPLDCYPLAAETPVFGEMYWGNGQRILRAAHQIRRTPGQYGLYCTNYACGPDSFNLHFFAHSMTGKPFAVIETDGHSGDAGTKTRVEAFLHCVAQDRQASAAGASPRDLRELRAGVVKIPEILQRGERLLLPHISDNCAVAAGCFRGLGIAAEALPPPDAEALRLGRRHTSGKECLPMALTLGVLLRRLQCAGPDERFVYLMPRGDGPCRFGVYNLLNGIALERAGFKGRVRLWAPSDEGYFDGVPPGFAMLMYTGIMAADLLQEALLHAQPSELHPGAAEAVYRKWLAELAGLMERRAPRTASTAAALAQVASGRLFGARALLRAAAAEFTAVRGPAGRPTVLLVGEIYVRSVPFANDFVIEKLQRRGLAVRLAPIHEWLDYCDHLRREQAPRRGFMQWLNETVQSRIQSSAFAAVDPSLGHPERHGPEQLLAAARPYLRDALIGEAALTVGSPLLAWRQGTIAGVVSAGPHECMPNKLAESQFFHVAEDAGLPSLTLPLNGDSLDPEILDNFAFEIHARHRREREAAVVLE